MDTLDPETIADDMRAGEAFFAKIGKSLTPPKATMLLAGDMPTNVVAADDPNFEEIARADFEAGAANGFKNFRVVYGFDAEKARKAALRDHQFAKRVAKR